MACLRPIFWGDTALRPGSGCRGVPELSRALYSIVLIHLNNLRHAHARDIGISGFNRRQQMGVKIRLLLRQPRPEQTGRARCAP